MYFEARYLSTASARFLSRDPIAQAFSSAILLKDPQMQNAYSYSRNNPINYVDPDGEWPSLAQINSFANKALSVEKFFGNLMTFGTYGKAIDNVGAAGQQMATEGVSVKTVANTGYQVALGTGASGVAAAFNGAIMGLSASVSGASRVAPLVGESLDIGSNLGKLGTIVENTGQTITGYTRHGLSQKISRSVPTSAILNAARNPLVTIEQSSGTVLRVTQQAGVVLNRAGRVVTTYGKEQFNNTISKIISNIQ